MSQIRAQAKRALFAEQRRAQEDAERNARRRSGQSSSVDRTPIAIKRPKREGEWGVFSYAPDRPPGGAAPRKAGGLSPDGRPAASGFGSTERLQQRLGSSELVDRMKKERARATEASRARAAAAAAAAAVVNDSTGGGVGGDFPGSGHQHDATCHRPSEPNGTAYKNKARGRGGDGAVEEVHPHRPLPSSKQRSGVPPGGRQISGAGDDRGGGGAGYRRVDPARQGGLHTSPQRRHRPAPNGDEEDIQALYEERLAALEQRLAGGGGGGRGRGGNQTGPQKRNPLRNPSGASDPPGAEEQRASGAEMKSTRKQQQRQHEHSQSSMPRGGGESWREESNPFGYRQLSAGRAGSSDSVPSSGVGGSGTATLSRRGSDASGGEDLQGLSTMYMGPIAHKMAELRAENG